MCVVCYCVIAAPYVRSVVSLHTVTLLMTIWNTQWTISSLYSLRLFFTYHYHVLLFAIIVYMEMYAQSQGQTQLMNTNKF